MIDINDSTLFYRLYATLIRQMPSYWSCSPQWPELAYSRKRVHSCVTAVTCDAISDLQNGSVSCSHAPAGDFTFQSSCSFTCHEGFLLQGPAQVECTARGQWTQQAPVCAGEPDAALPPERLSGTRAVRMRPVPALPVEIRFHGQPSSHALEAHPGEELCVMRIVCSEGGRWPVP